MAKRPNIHDIIQAGCDVYGVPLHYPSQKTRKREVVWIRQTLHYLVRNLTYLTYREIGEIIGKRDHATAMHSCKVVANEYKMYDDRKDFVDAIERELTFMGFSIEHLPREYGYKP